MKDRHLLVDVALGRINADKVVVNGEFLDVATGRIRKGVNIAIKGERIAKIGNIDDTIGPETEVIDAEGMIVTPGSLTVTTTSSHQDSALGDTPS